MKALSFLACMLFMQFSFAQYTDNNYSSFPKFDVPKSPNASSFERYVSVPRNYQTGQVSPSVPLMSFNIDGLTVPLNLNYSNTGLRVSDLASWVGLGWNLQVGGIITQEVRGIPDDGEMGLMTPFYAQRVGDLFKNQLTASEKLQYFKDVLNSLADTEHDLFTYDVLGVQGKFYINKFDKCVQTPNSNHKISFTLGSNRRLETFTIVDDKGNSYFFRNKEESVLTVFPDAHAYFNKLSGNTWWLSEIETINGERILFEYDHYSYTKTDISESQFFKTPTESCFQGFSSIPERKQIGTLVHVYQPKRIRWKNGFINFENGGYRSDLQLISESARVPFLAGISLYETPQGLTSNEGKLVKKNTFEYLNNSRLLLKKINLSTSTANQYEFKYVNESNDLLFPGYLPPQNGATAIDYWGYYNGAVSNPGFLPYDAISQYPTAGGVYVGMLIPIAQYAGRNNRIPNPEFAAYGMLNEIRYPTGGKSIFFYEGNKVRRDQVQNRSPESQTLINTLVSETDENNRIMVTLGGVRVRKIEFYDGLQQLKPSIVTQLSYDTSEIYTGFMPLFYSYIYREQYDCVACTGKYSFTLNSNSIVYNPAPVVQYGIVKETNGIDGTVGTVTYKFDFATLSRGGFANVPYLPAMYSSWRGGLRESSSKLASGKTIHVKLNLKEENNELNSSVDDYLNKYGYDLKIALIRDDYYRDGLSPADLLRCATFYSLKRSPNNQSEAEVLANALFKWEFGELPSDNYVLRSTVDTLYDGSNPLNKRITYNYHKQQRNMLLPNSSYTFNSKGDSLITLFTYPQDYFSTDINFSYVSPDAKVNGLLNLIKKNIKSVPVEKISLVNRNGIRYVVDAELYAFNPNKVSFSTVYKADISSPVPLTTFTRSYINSTTGNLVFDSRYKADKEYLTYNSLNQILEFTDKKNGVPHSLLWGYNSTYQTADVINAKYSEIAYTSFEAEDSGNWTIGSGSRIASGGFSGKKYYGLSSTKTIGRSGLSQGKKYIVSYWTLGAQALNIPGTLAGQTLKGATLNGWTYYEHLVSGVTSVTLNSSSEVGIDEVRLYPSDAQMKTYTYDPLIGMTSVVDAKNQISYYGYDDQLRLTIVKDQSGKVIQRTDYHYYQEQ